MQFPTLLHVAGVPLPLLKIGEHACPYLPPRRASDLVVAGGRVDSSMYQLLMDRGFRRSGDIFYRPDCDGCSACVPIRVPVATFTPTRSQRRAARKNRDVTVEIGEPRCDDERFDLFERYQNAQHDGGMSGPRADYERFFCESPVATIEMTYRAAGRIVGVGIVDDCPDCLSSVYFYFDPAEVRRSLGVYSALCEIDECRRRGKPYWYLGFFVAGCRKMEYKSQYGPHERLGADFVWRRNELNPSDSS